MRTARWTCCSTGWRSWPSLSWRSWRSCTDGDAGPPAAADAALRVRLYDADGRDREIPIEEANADVVGSRQLLWIDLDGRQPDDLQAIAHAVHLDPVLVRRLATEASRADLTSYPTCVHLTLQSLEPSSDDGGTGLPVRRAIDVVAGHGWVVSVHEGHLRAFDRMEAATEGETVLGALDAAGFMAAIADEVLTDYLELVEGMEREVDRLDEVALRKRPRSDVLAAIVGLRRRIGIVRRTLAPHRVAFAAAIFGAARWRGWL